MFYFKRINDDKEYEVSEYVNSYLKKNSIIKIKIYVGCDSQNFKSSTTYATTIVFHLGNNGCHFIYRKETIPKIKDMWTKLWGETKRSVEIANYLKNNNILIDSIDLDFNNKSIHWSNKLVSSSVGYVESMGFKANIKPKILPAISAADMMC
ncbi:MAG: hypothetical protein CL846_01290 [Crocinitomicaceae bacterium]|nr:hypothetical protein [Crocinitomicaceae bacterium]|tara:strand:+ start:6771 stop:7226 length:456 start_codon:yes stop_codon:yes gene_type:complete